MGPSGLGGARACRSTALVGKSTRWAWCRSKLLNGDGVRWPGIARSASDSGHVEVGSSASSSSPGARGCASDRQSPSLERNALTATARAVGYAWHVSTCASRDRRWSETLQRQRLSQWGRRWACGDPIRWDLKVWVTCPRAGHVSVHVVGTQHWAVARMRRRVRYCRRLSTTHRPEQTAPRRHL